MIFSHLTSNRKHLNFHFFNVMIWLRNTGEGRKRSQFSVPETAEYNLGVMEPDIVSLVGTVKTPSGNVEPCLLKKLTNGNLGNNCDIHSHDVFTIFCYKLETGERRCTLEKLGLSIYGDILKSSQPQTPRIHLMPSLLRYIWSRTWRVSLRLFIQTLRLIIKNILTS